ncbi:MAG: FliO/MopB family protein [Proteobacteria bacterium]|nr:FliO/MopB family protein [Pseudomonadota bacterium]
MDPTEYLRFAAALIFVLALIGAAAFALRAFGFMTPGNRNKAERRMSIVETLMLDPRRRLMIVRRDNVEHLLLIGGPSDVVVEPNIVRAQPAAAARDVVTTARAAAPPAEPPPRAPSTLVESALWPLNPEPALAPPRPISVDEAWPLQPIAEPASRPPLSDPLAGLGATPLRAPAAGENAAAADRRAPPRPRPQPTSSPEQTASDQNLAEMAQRLEAALRRPLAPGDNKPARAPLAARPPAPEADAPVIAAEPRPARTPEIKTPAPERKTEQAKSAFESLEKEMASLLGRPTDKS